MPRVPDAEKDADEKFDPGAIILEQQRKKDAQAAMKKHEAKSDQLDQVRKQVKLEDSKSALDTWGAAEAALKHVLSSKRQVAASASAGDNDIRDNGLRKHGEHVKHRRERSTQQAPQDSLRLQRSALSAGGRDLDDMEAAGSSGPGSPFGSAAAQQRRSQLRSQKSAGAAEKKADHERRRLRTKVATVLIEVLKRQELHKQQEKTKKFREQRFAAGRGPCARLGDHDEFALGLTCLSDSASEQATSPRRTALLESLALEELAVLREQPAFFFTGNAIAPAMSPEQAANAGSRSLSALPSVSSSSSPELKAPKGLWLGAVDASVFEDLIEFFSVSSAEKALDVSVYARNLRAQLLASAGRHNQGGTVEVDWRTRLCRNEPGGRQAHFEEQPTIDENVPKPPLEMMPCLGRHPPIRDDDSSPTLIKVREVYQRRDEQDARWVDERREGIARRVALNAFKASEQQRELLLQDFQQKELHKVRMLQAEEKKAMMDAEREERTEVMGIQKIHRLMVANERAERLKEEKRDQSQATLEAWQESVSRAQQSVRKQEWEKRKDGERNNNKYLKRLTAIAESRMHVVRTQGQKNDELKGRIQSSLASQLKEHQIEESMARKEDFRSKQDSASLRRHYAQLGNRYCFVEKAFGANAVGFDAKSHSVSVDRRNSSWQKSAEGWAKVKASFSAPELLPPRPLSPGGVISEAEFKALTSASGFKEKTLSVALT